MMYLNRLSITYYSDNKKHFQRCIAIFRTGSARRPDFIVVDISRGDIRILINQMKHARYEFGANSLNSNIRYLEITNYKPSKNDSN